MLFATAVRLRSLFDRQPESRPPIAPDISLLGVAGGNPPAESRARAKASAALSLEKSARSLRRPYGFPQADLAEIMY